MDSPFLTLISSLRRFTSQFRSPPVTPSTNSKIHYIASPNDVTITRDGDCARIEYTAERKHVAFEVPLGAAQIEYFARCDQWVPRGGVLRCLIQDDEYGQLIVKIDDQALPLKQFGKLLATYAGWGMRIEFVPEDEVHRRPVIEVREPMPEE